MEEEHDQFLVKAWKVLAEEKQCPFPLHPFIGSWPIEINVMDNRTVDGDGGLVTVAVVELAPGRPGSSVIHLAENLESFLDLDRKSIQIEPLTKARRVQIRINH